jgi:hypothetical protein
MAKLTESYLRNMIKQVINEAGTTPYPPPNLYHTYNSEPIPGDQDPISTLAHYLDMAIDENNRLEVLSLVKEIIDHPAFTNEDLMKVAEHLQGTLMVKGGSVQTRSDFLKADRTMRNAPHQ